MPKIAIDQFDSPPKMGDKVTVIGKVQTIDEATGEVEISYDSVKVNGKTKRNRDSDDNDESDDLPEEMAPNTQNLDEALSNAFPNTQ